MRWPAVPFADVADVVTGNTPPKKDPGNYGVGVPWVKPPDLDAWESVTQTEENLSPVGQTKARLLPAGTVMVCCIGSVGRVGISGTTLATNQQINSLIFGNLVNPKFGYYYCRSIKNLFRSLARQAVVPILNKGNFEKIEMPVPPLSEQRRIVEILDQADALRKKRADADAIAARILPALFLKMFGDPATNPMGWRQKPLDKEVQIIGGGTPCKSNASYWNGTVPWVSPKDMKHLIITDTQDHITNEAIKGSAASLIKRGSILIVVRSGILAHTVPLAMAGVDLTINQDMKALTPKTDSVDEYFLLAWLQVLHQTLLGCVKRGATVHSIDGNKFKSLPIILPSIDRQLDFSNKFQALIKMQINRESAKKNLNKLWDTLLHHAFSGELTAKWREAHMNDLLAEIEEQKKALEAADVQAALYF